MKRLADEVLRDLDPVFAGMYAAGDRPSVAPERLLKASVLMALYSARSERPFCEQLAYNMLFKWFLDMDILEEPFDASTFSHIGERPMEHELARKFFVATVDRPGDGRRPCDVGPSPRVGTRPSHAGVGEGASFERGTPVDTG